MHVVTVAAVLQILSRKPQKYAPPAGTNKQSYKFPYLPPRAVGCGIGVRCKQAR